MRKQMKTMAAGLMAAGLLVTGISLGATAYAANTDPGTTASFTDADYTVEEMLSLAIEDEYQAQAMYSAITETYGVIRPFSNVIKAEETHISLLTPLLNQYGVTLPDKDWASLNTVPESLEASYTAGITAEKNNIAMYESFLKKELPADVKDAFNLLLNASKKHLAAFERQSDPNFICNGNGNGNGLGRGRGSGNCGNSGSSCGNGGFGRGNRGGMQGSCIIQ